MSILLTESYANKGTPLWRSIGTSTPAPHTNVFTGGSNMGANALYPITGLTVGQRYTFTIQAGVSCVQIDGNPTIAQLNDGTNGTVLLVSATISPDSVNLPYELVTSASGPAGFLTTTFPGAICFNPIWSYNRDADDGFNYLSQSYNVVVSLTAKTTQLIFMIRNTNTSPTVASANKILLSTTIVYTQPIV